MYMKSVRPRMGPRGTPPLTQYSFEVFPSRTTQWCLLRGKDQIQ